MENKSGQIWIETVIYTLIGLSLIGLVLAILTPQIKEFKDRSAIEQSIDSLNVFDSKIEEVLDAPGNRRKVELTLAKGEFIIDATENRTAYEIAESDSMYSEPGLPIQVGRIKVTTFELTKKYRVVLEINYPLYDITFEGKNSLEKFSAAKIPYKFFINNNGTNPTTGVLQIDITEN